MYDQSKYNPKKGFRDKHFCRIVDVNSRFTEHQMSVGQLCSFAAFAESEMYVTNAK